MISVDLNCDLGESFGAYTIGMDEAVIPLITSANVACGYHAGDPLVMAQTVERCRAAGVHIGAHPQQLPCRSRFRLHPPDGECSRCPSKTSGYQAHRRHKSHRLACPSPKKQGEAPA